MSENKQVHVQYYALLREQRGLSQEDVQTSETTALRLYESLKKLYGFSLSTDLLRVAVNGEFKDWGTEIFSGDTVVFIPPVAGG